MGENKAVNVALGILVTTGAAVVWSAIDSSWKMPPEIWGLAVAAYGYIVTTAKRKGSDEDDD